jgi:hypothetical protein
MALLSIHYVRLHWLVLVLNVGVRVVKHVLVVSGGDVIDLLQRIDCASEFAQVDFGQDAGGISVGGIQSGQEGALTSHTVAHVGGNRVCDDSVTGFGFGTKVGKHWSDLLCTSMTCISISKTDSIFFLMYQMLSEQLMRPKFIGCHPENSYVEKKIESFSNYLILQSVFPILQVVEFSQVVQNKYVSQSSIPLSPRHRVSHLCALLRSTRISSWKMDQRWWK